MSKAHCQKVHLLIVALGVPIFGEILTFCRFWLDIYGKFPLKVLYTRLQEFKPPKKASYQKVYLLIVPHHINVKNFPVKA
jgi:hypothetical protein